MKRDYDNMKLTKEEQEIEDAIGRGEYVRVSKEREAEIVAALEYHKKKLKKDAVLNLRISNMDLKALKKKAKKMGMKYQTYISEILHQHAKS